MNKSSKIYIAGHNGMVGSALVRNLKARGYNNLLTRTSKELDLTNQQQTKAFFEKEKPEYVFLAAAKVGGIIANNTYRADFIYQNLQIQNNVIHQSYLSGVKKLLFLGSSCIYPKNAPQPLKEDYLLTSELEYTNEPYAIAKIAGIKMCEAYNLQYGTNFLSVMPTNLYGPNDNYNLEKSHVLPALIRKMHLGKCLENNNWEAIRKDFNKRPVEEISGESRKEEIVSILSKYGINQHTNPNSQLQVTITLWGTGTPRREFLHADDLAEACIFLMENIDFNKLNTSTGTSEIKNTHINIGTGKDISIIELAELIKSVIGFHGEINQDTSKPDGTMRKLMDVSKINGLGWEEEIELKTGIEKIYKNYKE